MLDVLLVCTGNICRSPTAERLLRARAAQLPLRFSSAGTAGLVGRAMDRDSATALDELGVDPRGHLARRLDAAMIATADLVLTADAAQRSIVVRAEPMAFRSVFTLREFARLGAGLGPLPGIPDEQVLRGRIAQVASQRGGAVAAAGADDIDDPFGAGLDVARHIAAIIDVVVDGVLRALGRSVELRPEPLADGVQPRRRAVSARRRR